MYPQETSPAFEYAESPVSKYYPAGNGLADFGDDSDQMMYPSSPSPSHIYGSQRQAYAPQYDPNAQPAHGHDVYSYYDEPHDAHPVSPTYAPAFPTSSQGYPRNFGFATAPPRQNAVSQPRQSPWLRGKQSQANEPPRQPQETFSAHDNSYAETSYSHEPSHGRTTADDRSPHGIRLRPVSELPDVYRSLFKFGVFNAVQSSCFDDVVHGANNLVISAPTGSGKTVLFELAIIRMLKQPSAERQQFKCVYVSPTKALCSERFRDWSAKFEPMGIKCSELTGDTIHFGKGVWGDAKNASIIITTPEKWDSVTRNWKDHGQTLSTIQLFLVDEVHILNENRGSTLEVIVSRMKRNGTNVRFVLVSATVPNIQDIANWIGNEQRSGPARVYEFGEDFRPCKLTRHVYGVHRGKGQNEFAFNKNLDYRLFPLLLKHSVGKPMLIFVSTRSGVLATGQHLLKCYVDAETKRENVPWNRPPRIDHVFHDQRLAELAAAGIGIHHAGLNLDDRRAIEDLYIKKVLRLVVATSTLAVGVNLPAHMVVIKGVQTFQNNMAVEYSDLDVMQMLGRAGRPQFDKDGIAIILCETELEDKYRALAQGQTILESSLHSNLSEHLNSEIALGTITNLDSAKTWLRGSFLFQRIKQNPNYYSLGKEDDQTWEQRVDDLVMQSIERLQETQLVEYDTANSRGGGGLASTDFGDIMSKFYIRQKTMELILALPERVSFRETMEMLAASEEFSDIKMRTSEKAPLNRLRQHNDIRYTIKKLDKAADKVFLLMQAILGGISLNSPDYKSVDSQPNLEALLIFRHVSRIARAIVETAIARKFGAQIKAGLELLRCLSAKAWEDRPVVLRQIEQIGEKSLKVLAEHGVTTIDSLRSQDTLRIETLLNRRSPFGLDLINSLKEFPKYSLTLSEISVSTYRGAKPVEVCLTVNCGLDAEWSKPHKSKKLKAAGANMTSVLAISSDLDFIDYRRIPTSLLKEKKTFDLTAYLSKPSQSILVVISCESMAGVTVTESYKPNVPGKEYPTMDTRPLTSVEQDLEGLENDPDFWNMDVEDTLVEVDVKDLTAKGSDRAPVSIIKAPTPTKLPNGKYTCNHSCKDKTKCRHLCCRDGLADPPKSKKRKHEDENTPATKPVEKEPSYSHGRTVLDRLEALHEKTNVAKNLGLTKDKRIRLEQSSSPEICKPKKRMVPRTDLQLADLKDPDTSASTVVDIEDIEDNDDDLPEVYDLLKLPSSEGRAHESLSDAEFANPQMDALIASLPSDEIRGPASDSGRFQPPGLASPVGRFSSPHEFNHEYATAIEEPLFLQENHPTYTESYRRSEDSRADDLGFELDWTSIEVVPSPQPALRLRHEDPVIETPEVPTDNAYEPPMEAMDDPDEFAELDAWFDSGAVEIVDE